MAFEFTDDNFKTTTESGIHVVDVWAEWCGRRWRERTWTGQDLGGCGEGIFWNYAKNTKLNI